MSSGAPAPRSKVAARVALIRARSGISPLAILLLPVGLMAYAFFAQAAELIGQSITAVVMLSVLAGLCGAGMLLRPSADRLELFRVFSFYYLMAFCIAPLFEPAISMYVLEEPRPALLERTAALALFAFVSIGLGYHLPLYRTPPKLVLTRHDEYNAPLAIGVGLALFVIGAISFVALFVLAGGSAVILEGQGGLARTEFSFGLGWYYWTSLFMLPGGVVYFAAQASRTRLLAWLHAWPLVSAFALLMLLQGRHRAMGPILLMFAVSHYLIRRIRLTRLAVYAVAGLAFAIVMSTARSPSFRGTFATDPIGYTVAILRDFPDRGKEVLAGDIGRVDEVMIIIDHVPDLMPYDWGWSLTIPLNPFRRLVLGPRSEAPAIGNRLYLIARPDMRTSLYTTGFLPSIVGEMRANFPFLVCFFPFLLFGMLLRYVYQRLILEGADFLAVAAYVLLGFHLSNTTINAFGQNSFEMLVVALPVLIVRKVARRRSRVGTRPPALPEPVPSPRA